MIRDRASFLSWRRRRYAPRGKVSKSANARYTTRLCSCERRRPRGNISSGNFDQRSLVNYCSRGDWLGESTAEKRDPEEFHPRSEDIFRRVVPFANFTLLLFLFFLFLSFQKINVHKCRWSRLKLSDDLATFNGSNLLRRESFIPKMQYFLSFKYTIFIIFKY